MSHWETPGASDHWFTPKYIFDALACEFDMDVAGPLTGDTHVPARVDIVSNSLEDFWEGFIWMNPPFGGRNGIEPWLDKFFAHNNGIALTPDRTSAPWFQRAAVKADALLFLSPKVKFERPDGTPGGSPSNGTALMAAGPQAVAALSRARQLGLLVYPASVAEQRQAAE